MNPDCTVNQRENDREWRLTGVIEAIVRRRADGDCMSDDAIIAEHPELMPELADALQTLQFVEEAQSEARSRNGLAEGTASHSEATDGGPTRLPPNTFPGYILLGEFHRGGQGVVYRAIQDKTARTVAIKIMHEGPFAGSHGKARFEREVRLLARIKHPNIVTIHESGTASGSHYFVMDWIAGQPLDTYALGRNRSVREALGLFRKICEAVNAAHLRGIIHRDLKPSNILIDADGEPHILDFGLAKADSDEMDDAAQLRSMTVTGQFVGSLPWASPEQAEGSPDQIDLRTDVYSLGVVLYQVLTGKFPYPVMGKMREALSNILEAEPARPSAIRKDINDEVETIVLKCLAKEPDRRYQSAGELARDLGCYLSGEPIEAKRESTLYVLRKQMRRYRIPLAVVGGFVVLVTISSIVGWTLYSEARDRLWESSLSQARLQRMSRETGQRTGSLAALETAAAIRPSIDVRNEVIASLALPDVRITERWKCDLLEKYKVFARADANLEYVVFWDNTGRLIVRRWAENQDLLHLAPLEGEYAAAIPRFSDDSRLLARGTKLEAEVWDIEDGELVVSFPVRLSGADSLDFKPDGSELAAAASDGSIHICDLQTHQTRVLPGAPKAVSYLRYHPEQPLLAAASSGSGEVLVLSSRTGQVSSTLTHTDSVLSLGWDPAGRLLACGCYDNHVHIWDWKSGKSWLDLEGHWNVPSMVQFVADGNMLISCAWDGTTRLWDLAFGRQILRMNEGVLGVDQDSVGLVYRDKSNPHTFVKAEVIRSPVVETIGSGYPKDGRESAAVSRDGRFVAHPCKRGVQLWDLARREHLALLPGRGVRAVLFRSSPPELITFGTAGGSLRWPFRAGATDLHIGPPKVLLPESYQCWTAELSFDETLLAVAVNARDVLLCNLEQAVAPRVIGPHPTLRWVTISPDKKWVATGGWHKGGARVWDLSTGELVRDLSIDRAVTVGFSPNGRWLVTSETEHTVWAVGTWEPVARFPRVDFRGFPGPVIFSPDGALVAVGAAPRARDMGVIELIDLVRLEPLARLEGGLGGSPVFTPDGSQLCRTAGSALSVWDLRAVREQLADMNLDWDLPPYAPAEPTGKPKPLRVEVDLGELAPPSAEHATQE